jgi:hypothetical protein
MRLRVKKSDMFPERCEASPAVRRSCRRVNRRLTHGSRRHLSKAGHRKAFGRMFECRLFKSF